jgi:hypothetical protein
VPSSPLSSVSWVHYLWWQALCFWELDRKVRALRGFGAKCGRMSRSDGALCRDRPSSMRFVMNMLFLLLDDRIFGKAKSLANSCRGQSRVSTRRH